VTRVIAVIPARMGSTRFPGKPLAQLHGRPMIEHVYRRTAACGLLDDTLIATCDEEIARASAAFGAKVVMTSPRHVRATDRVAEAASGDPAGIVVMVQGDEPMIGAPMIAAAVTPLLADGAISCVNLAAPIHSENEFRNPNTIKTVMSRTGDALYFSREPIPTTRTHSPVAGGWLKQVCVISFRSTALRTFTELPEGPLEIAESIDMLRFLENGISVRLVRTEARTHAVDTPEDLALVASLMALPTESAGQGGKS
jgi:3-deoxy-manno-octulosonate cytidylyltransferase (CMP-KDO synthetase)